MPGRLVSKPLIDLRGGLEKAGRELATELSAAIDINFRNLDAASFERMALDLLRALGYSISSRPLSSDGGFGALVSAPPERDAEQDGTEIWAIQVKHHSTERAGVRVIDGLLQNLLAMPVRTKLLLVTSGRLTSVARTYLHETAHKNDRDVRLLEASDLIALLIDKPALVRQYFPRAYAS